MTGPGFQTRKPWTRRLNPVTGERGRPGRRLVQADGGAPGTGMAM
ncbi:hypothetical protein [Frankia nepalensis]|nr:hypothetical protein [Frankia nepalensis]